MTDNIIGPGSFIKNDIIRNDLTLLDNKKLFVLDMDGTFYLGDHLIEGSLDFIRRLGETGRRYMFFTNNSSRTLDFYVRKLAKMGCEAGEGSVVTSGDVTIEYLHRNYPSAGVYLLGTELLHKSFYNAGIKLVEDKPDIVVVGFDTTLSYDRVSKACRFIRDGAVFLATHPDFNCPTEEGFIPDCGSMCAMITASTGAFPKYLGKPYPETIEMIKTITGVDTGEMAFVGDRLYTDIAIGVKNGVTAILVFSGETKPGDIEGSQIIPDLAFSSLGELAEYL